jgi:hypothetical protein
MLAKPKLGGPLAASLAASALLFSACSSSHPRDINYGTDAGVGFVPVDVGPSLDTSSALDGSAGSESGASESAASAASAASNDGGDQADVSIDTNK